MFDGQLSIINKATRGKLPIELLIHIAAMISGEQPYNLFCPITKYLISNPVSIARTEEGELDPTIIYDRSSILKHHPEENKNIIEQPTFKALSVLVRYCLKNKIPITGKHIYTNGVEINVLEFLQRYTHLTESKIRVYPFYRALKKNMRENKHKYISTVFSLNDKRAPIFLPHEKHTSWCNAFYGFQLALAVFYPISMGTMLYNELCQTKSVKALLLTFSIFSGLTYFARNAKEIATASSLTSEFSTKPVTGRALLPIVWLSTAVASFGTAPFAGIVYLKDLLNDFNQDKAFYPLLALICIGYLTQCLLSLVTAKMIFHTLPFYFKSINFKKNMKANLLAISLLALVATCYTLDRHALSEELAPKIQSTINTNFETHYFFYATMLSWLPKLIAFTLFVLHKIDILSTSKHQRFRPENIIYNTTPSISGQHLNVFYEFILNDVTRAAVALVIGTIRCIKTESLASLAGYTGAILIEFYLADITVHQIGASFISLKTLASPTINNDTVIEIKEIKNVSSELKRSFSSYQTDSDEEPSSRSNSPSKTLPGAIRRSKRKGSEHEEPLLDASSRQSSVPKIHLGT